MRSKVIFFSTLLLFLTLTSQIYSQTENRTCRIKSMIGSVKIRRSGTVNWINARVGMPLRERDGIRTFVESEAELESSEGSLIKIGENSTLELSDFQQTQNSQKTNVKVMHGNILSNVKKLVGNNSSFEFETPTATAAIRGTTVGLEVSKDLTSIKVYEGKVLVTPRGKRKGTILKENEMTTVTRKTKSIAVEQFTSSAGSPDSSLKSITDSTTSTDSVGIETVADSAKLSSTDTLMKDSHNDSLQNTKTENIPETETDSLKDTGALNSIKAPLKLTVISPQETNPVLASSQLTVSGSVTPFGSSVTINGKTIAVSSGGAFKTTISVPQKSGYFEINITADFEGSSQTVIRTVKVNSANLVFSVDNPKDKQIFAKPIIPVNGTVSAGAEVTIMSMNIPVTVQGTFNSQFPIPNEEGEYTLEFEASLDGKTQRINRTVIYRPEYRFTLNQPQERQIVTSTKVQIKGEVFPPKSSLSVQGKRIPVSPQGTFSGVILITEEEGEVIIDFEIISGGISRTEKRTLIYKKPPDTFSPQLQGVLPPSTQLPRLSFTVIDRTEDEEITFICEIDGVKEVQNGQPNSPFFITLLEGMHNYKVYAVDKAGNKSQVISQTVSYLGASVWNIRLRKPLSDIVLNLPPSTPDGNYKPRYPVEFSIDDLPDDNIKMIREVNVINTTTSEKIQLKNLTESYIDVDIGIKHRATNTILIEALDVNNVKKTKKLQIHVR